MKPNKTGRKNGFIVGEIRRLAAEGKVFTRLDLGCVSKRDAICASLRQAQARGEIVKTRRGSHGRYAKPAQWLGAGKKSQ